MTRDVKAGVTLLDTCAGDPGVRLPRGRQSQNHGEVYGAFAPRMHTQVGKEPDS